MNVLYYYYCRYASAVLAIARTVCPSVCPSHSWSVKTAKPIVMKPIPDCILGYLVFLCQI